MANRCFLSVVAFLGAVVCTAGHLQAQNPTSTKIYTLSKVTFAGSKRFTQTQLLTASGLRIGQKLTLQGIDDASARLYATGILSKIGYNFRFIGDSIEVVYDVADASKFLPCTYDNFVWFSDAELTAAVQKQIPLFDGSLPAGGNMSETVSAAIDGVLSEHKISGSTMVMPEGELGHPVSNYRVTITGILIPVVAVNVAGGPLDPNALANSVRLLMSGNYSRSAAHAAAVGGMTESYKNEAYLQVQFSGPVVTMKDSQHTDASQGVTITFTVTPGPLYTWGGVEWAGNQIIPETDLTKLTDMSLGELARQKKLNDGWSAVNNAYGHLGYLMAKIDPSPQFDPGQHLVRYRVSVAEGEQYFMGEFHVSGVPDAIASGIQKAWKLRAGQPYDKLYEKEFMRTELGRAWNSVAGHTPMPTKLSFMPGINSKTHVVNPELQIH